MATTKVCIGELRHYLTFQRNVVSASNDIGARSIAWVDVRSVWAKMETKSATENADGDRKVQVSKYVFTIRFVDGLTSSMRILYRGVHYSVQAVYDKDGLGKWLTVEATKDDSNTGSGVV